MAGRVILNIIIGICLGVSVVVGGLYYVMTGTEESENTTYIGDYRFFLEEMKFRDNEIVDLDEKDIRIVEDRAQHLPVIDIFYVITVKGKARDVINHHILPAGWGQMNERMPIQFVKGRNGLLYYMLVEQDGNEVRITIHHEKFMPE